MTTSFSRKNSVLSPHSAVLRKFHYFKSLLAGNNALLEQMADLERMIYEGRSFTLEEAIAGTSDLLKHGCMLVEDLNAMCSGRFTILFDQLEAIGHSITQSLARERTFDNPNLVMPLDAINLDNLDEVGGKAANLGEIRNRVGLPTPDGFAVTASAAALFLRETGLIESLRRQLADIDVSDIGALEKVCAKASERIMTAPLPEPLRAALTEKAKDLVDRFGPKVRLAVRSSAVCEDSESSFAGQHATVLGATPETLSRAWSAVVASAFTARAVFYRRTKGYSEQDVMMSVLVLPMVDSKASGVLYTIDPNSACNDDLSVSSAWGLGVSVVDGSSNVDFWQVRRSDRKILQSRIAKKSDYYTVLSQGGIVSRPVSADLQLAPSLKDAQVQKLITYALLLEEHYGMPLDVEWAMDDQDQIFILQARPLARAQGLSHTECLEIAPGHSPLLIGGQSASHGVASGLVYHIQSDHTPLHSIPQGAILVAKHTSPSFVAAMGKVAGIITDVGSTTGHMASVAREFGIPTLVGVGRATHLLPHGTEITLDATNAVIYAGQVQELLTERKPINLMQGSPVYKSLQNALKYIVPLNLLDPQLPNFTPAACETLHDIIRLCHEEAMREMFHLSDDLTATEAATYELHTELPFHVFLFDLGQGIMRDGHETTVEIQDLRCNPLRALLAGMANPDMAAGKAGDARTPASYAIISDKYMNFSGRLGNHFATVDAFAGPVINDNYITFSFKGGAAEYQSRVRRATLLTGILRRLGFRVVQSGDSLKAEIRKYDEARFLDRLTVLGRLLASVRNLDLDLNDDADVTRRVDDFYNSVQAANRR